MHDTLLQLRDFRVAKSFNNLCQSTCSIGENPIVLVIDVIHRPRSIIRLNESFDARAIIYSNINWRKQLSVGSCISPDHRSPPSIKISILQHHHQAVLEVLNMAMRPVNAVPGSVQLVDINGTSTSKHACGRIKDVVLIPAPSEHPDDPLNWSLNRKRLSIASVCL